MTNLEIVQKLGWEVVNQIKDENRVDQLTLGILQTMLELIAAIADKIGVSNEPMQVEQEDE